MVLWLCRANLDRQQQRQEGNEEGEPSASGQFDNPSDAVALVVHYESMSRNKKLLLSYM